MNDLERTYTPAEAAEEYGFAPSLLRRYAAIYESLGGTISTNKRGGRIYSADLLKHFSAARERVQAGEKVEYALNTLELAPVNYVQDVKNDIDAQRVLSSNERLQQEVAALQNQVKQLEASPQNSDSETARMNKYLLGELERRRLEAEQHQQRRPWWQLWGRR